MEAREGVLLDDGAGSEVLTRCKDSGFHTMNGIFLAYGPDIKRDSHIQDPEIIDLTPTILHILGLPIPEDMDGKVLRSIFVPGSETAKREVKFQKPSGKGGTGSETKYSSEDEEKIRARLKALGYM
jgi:hypothetical protein